MNSIVEQVSDKLIESIDSSKSTVNVSEPSEVSSVLSQLKEGDVVEMAIADDAPATVALYSDDVVEFIENECDGYPGEFLGIIWGDGRKEVANYDESGKYILFNDADGDYIKTSDEDFIANFTLFPVLDPSAVTLIE